MKIIKAFLTACYSDLSIHPFIFILVYGVRVLIINQPVNTVRAPSSGFGWTHNEILYKQCLRCDHHNAIQAYHQQGELWVNERICMCLPQTKYLCSTGWLCRRRQNTQESLFPLTSPSNAEKRQNFTNEKLYLRIPTSVDAIIFTMQNGKYNAVLLTKMVLIDLTIYVLPLQETEVTLYMSRIDSSINKHSTNTTILS